MTGFEPHHTSCVRSDRSTNWVTTTAPDILDLNETFKSAVNMICCHIVYSILCESVKIVAVLFIWISRRGGVIEGI